DDRNRRGAPQPHADVCRMAARPPWAVPALGHRALRLRAGCRRAALVGHPHLTPGALLLPMMLVLGAASAAIAKEAAYPGPAGAAVVSISGQLGGTAAMGAGIVGGREKDRLYVATGNHVARRGNVDPTDVKTRL